MTEDERSLDATQRPTAVWHRRPGPGARTDAAAPLLFFCVLLAACSVGLGYESVVRQPGAYLDPGDGPPRWAATGAAAIGALCGLAGARSGMGQPRQRLVWLLLAASLTATASALTLFFAFASTGCFDVAVIIAPALVGAVLAATLHTAARTLGRPAKWLGIFQRTLNPLAAGVAVLALTATATAATYLGLLRSAVLLGVGFATLAWWGPALFWYLDRKPLRNAHALRQASLLVLGGHLIVFALIEWLVPASELGKHAGEIVYARATQRQRYVITSGQSSFALFVDDQLKVSTLDDYRYREALVHPVLALSQRPERVLLLGGGDGLAEREILRHPAVEKLTVVVVDRALAELAASMHWLRRRSQAAALSPRVAVVEAEPIVWLGESQEVFDVVIVDLADPLGHLEGKNYTRYFYRKLAQRLAPQGVAVIQATSPFRSPGTFASIQRTIVAAGLQVLPYRAPIPSFGDWGFVLAAHRPLRPPPPPPAGLAFLSTEMQRQLFLMPADATAAEAAALSTLHDPAVVEVFARERAR